MTGTDVDVAGPTGAAADEDRFAAARRVADTVLYEGYVLYPYRASAAKNQLRWQFGVLAPAAHQDAGGSASSSMHTECVADVAPGATLTVRIRFLQVQARIVEQAREGSEEEFTPVESLVVAGRRIVAWDEAVEHEVEIAAALAADDLVREPREMAFTLPGGDDIEPLVDDDGRLVGRVVRRREPVAATARVEARPAPGPWSLLTVALTVENVSHWTKPDARHDEVVRRSLVAIHGLLAVDGGRFVSMVDPPEFAREAVAACVNTGCWPVPMGEEGAADLVLASPIILPEHPEIAPESSFEMCDATEIDEILALRVMTLTEDEKDEVRATDERAAAILDRCDTLPPELLDRLHGAVRSLRDHDGPPLDVPTFATPGPAETAAELVPGDDEEKPWWDPGVDSAFDPWEDSVLVGSVPVRRGSRVRLQPGRRADAQDLFVAGSTATVQGVFHDVDGDTHVAVTLDDDPAADLQQWHGRFLYFHPDEVEPLPVDPQGRP
jgi:hypothetical protein